MHCIFCKSIIPATLTQSPHHFYCPSCRSYYHFQEIGKNYLVFDAYPEKTLKKYHQNRKIRIPKETAK